jgi:hypothetical protein
MRFIKGDNLKEAIKRFHDASEPASDPAGERGFKDIPHLKRDPDLKTLHDRVDYKGLFIDPKARVIIVGHTRYKAAQKLGLEKVPVHVARGVPDCRQSNGQSLSI